MGADTHSDTHVGVALDVAGGRSGELAVTNDRSGCARLWDWAMGFGVMTAAGVRGHGQLRGRPLSLPAVRGASVLELNRTSR
ncbi:MAG: hypothetical protein M3R38_06280 [Actinomycetota bacterium]|nr:hypothetical protein [Actinomycetota bacterium]MDP9486356.1 hypothetical protein [Actinomycetota bacterium]